MKLQLKILVGTMLICLLSLGLQAQGRWIIKNANGASSKVVSGEKYYLRLDDNEYYLKYKYRKTGISLVWEKAASPNITFTKQGGGDIKCGDRVAIQIENARYLVYGEQTWGINLNWSDNPVYEWEIRSKDNKKGTSISTNEIVGLYNSRNTGFVVYCDRKGMPVVNLAWFSECHGGKRLPGALNELTTQDLIKIGTYVIPLVL